MKEKQSIIKQMEEGRMNPKIGITKIDFFNNKNFEGVDDICPEADYE